MYQDIVYQQENLFPTQLNWKWTLNMIKVLWFRVQQCLKTFTMLLVEGSSQTGLSRHLYDYVFGVRNFGNTKSMRVVFFFKIFKIWARFQISNQKLGKCFCFWDNCIWLGLIKLSLLRIGYSSSVANVLTRSHKIFHVNTEIFPTQLTWQWSLNMIKVLWCRFQK